MKYYYLYLISSVLFAQLYSMEKEKKELQVPISPRKLYPYGSPLSPRKKLLPDADPRAELIAAIHEGNVEKVKICLDKEAKESNDDHKRKECKDDDPYGIALSAGSTAIVEEFIRHGYSVDQLVSYKSYNQSPRVKTPREASESQKQNRKPNKKLIEQYKDIKRAIKSDKPNRLDKLLKTLYVDVRFKEYRTPLHIACLLHKAKCAKVLITKGANVNAYDMQNYSPLYLAVHGRKQQYPRLIKLLLKRNANLQYASDLAKSEKDEDAFQELQKYNNKQDVVNKLKNISQATVNFDFKADHIG